MAKKKTKWVNSCTRSKVDQKGINEINTGTSKQWIAQTKERPIPSRSHHLCLFTVSPRGNLLHFESAYG